MHSDSVFIFDRAGKAREVVTDTSDVKGIAKDLKMLVSN